MTITSPFAMPALPTASNDPLIRFIMRLSAFERLGQNEISALLEIIKLGVVPPYESLDKNAESEFTVLLSGLAGQYRSLSPSRRQIISLIAPGDISHYGFLTGNTARGQITSLALSQVGHISIIRFAELCEQYPQIMRATLRGMATANAIAQERLLSIGQRTSMERVSHLICEMYYRLGVVGLVGYGNTFDVHMTQAELGHALGLSTVHVNRTLQAMRHSDLITMHKSKLSIENLPGLVNLAGFDPSYLLQENFVTCPAGPTDVKAR